MAKILQGNNAVVQWLKFLIFYISWGLWGNRSWQANKRRESVQPLSCPTLCNPSDWSTPGFPVHHQLAEFTQLMSIESVMPSNHLILCRPLLPPSVFPSVRVFSSESVLRIRWPEYWSFSFSISPSNESLGGVLSGLPTWKLNKVNMLK